MEGVAGWHGKAPDREQLDRALAELDLDLEWDVESLLATPRQYQQDVDTKLEDATPRFTRDYWWNRSATMKVDMEPTRFGFGQCLQRRGDDPRLCCLGADISDSIVMSRFYKDHPERLDRWFSMWHCGAVWDVRRCRSREGREDPGLRHLRRLHSRAKRSINCGPPSATTT